MTLFSFTYPDFSPLVYDFIHDDLRRQYTRLGSRVRITLVEASDRILGGFNKSLSDYAMKKFNKGGVAIKSRVAVKGVEADHVILSDGTRVRFF